MAYRLVNEYMYMSVRTEHAAVEMHLDFDEHRAAALCLVARVE